MSAPLSRDEFEARLRAQGAGYHIHHPFNVRMNNGQLTPTQIRGWVANRFYYQKSIPLKDAAILANPRQLAASLALGALAAIAVEVLA